MRTFYDPLEHAYYINGRRVVSVTQALTLADKIDTRWFTEEARNRGLAVHEYCERYDRRLPLGIPADAGVDGPIEAYQAFLADHQPRWKYIEKGLFHATDAYGGRPDRVGIVRGSLATVELKTGQEADWHGLQLAGYQGLQPAGARYVLYLGANGRYRLARCRRAADYPEFRECLLYARAAIEGGGVPI